MISLNLLPFSRKEIFHWRQQTKKVISRGIKTIFLLIFFVIPLYMIDFYLTEEIKVLGAQIESSESTESMRQLNSIEKSFKEINSTLVKINKFSEDQIYWEDIFSKISLNIPLNVQLFSLQIESDGVFSITGNAKTREDVLELGKRFKDSDSFSDIQTPLDNLIKKEDINFRFNGKIILEDFKRNDGVKKEKK